MKNKAIKSLILLIMTTLSVSVFGQTWTNDSQSDANAILVGSTFKYMVTAVDGNTYLWEVTKTDGGAVETGAVTLTAETTNEVTITWNTEGDYIVNVTETSQNNCSTIKSFQVKVKANNTIATWDAIPSDDCSMNEGNTLTFKIKCENGVGPWKAEYYVNEDEDSSTTHPTSTSILETAVANWNETEKLLTITISNYKVALGQGSYPVTLTIVSLKDKYGVSYSNDSFILTKEVQIHRNPNTSDIQHN